MQNELERQLRRLNQGDHSCLLYETKEEQRGAMVPFFVEGLALGERCLYIADDRTVDEVKSFLAEAGVDVPREMDKGSFTVLTKRDSYLQGGAFHPERMIELLAERVEGSVAQGFTGMRGSGEMTWALGTEVGCDRVMEFEARLNDYFPGKPFVAICQFNRRRFNAAMTLDVLRTHPYAILGNHVCPNIYFEPRDMVLGRPTDADRLEWQLLQLTKAREDVLALEHAIQARDAFFNVAAHELRTPLTTLQLRLSQVLNDVQRSFDPEQCARHVQGALDQLHKLKHLCSTLTDTTQLHESSLELNKERVDLLQIARAVVDAHTVHARKAGSRIVLEGESVVGWWDPRRIEQLVAALLSNAIKFGAASPVTLLIQKRSEAAILKMKDHGIGISPQDQTRLFAPFARAVTDEHYSGFGLGLWTAQRIVDAHGGVIAVDSAPGEGATFRVRLPLGQSRRPELG